MVANLSNNH